MKEVPMYFEVGSIGTMAVNLQSFLLGWTVGKELEVPEGFRVDNVYGQNAALLMRRYQRSKKLTPDGACGPETRKALEADGYRFDEIARNTLGISFFVQPDGEKVSFDNIPKEETIKA